MKFTLKWLKANYVKTEHMVPMRDGIRLYTSVYAPASRTEASPVMLVRTPYPLNPYGKTFIKDLRTHMDNFVANGYILVYQNVRGTFRSEGEFINVRPLSSGDIKDPARIDEATDTYDTADWIITHLNTNGSIGVKGISYPGFYATMAAISGHPAIKAVSPQAPVTDWYIGDDAHLNGAYQYGMYSFGAAFCRNRKKPCSIFPKPVIEIEGNPYDFFMDFGGMKNAYDALEHAFRERGGVPEFISQLRDHPDYDDFWQSRNAVRDLSSAKAAFLVVGGWYDAEDFYGSLATYRAAKENGLETSFACGPWFHGAWKRKRYDCLGDATFGRGSAEYFMDKIEYPFFAWYLEGRGTKPQEKAWILPSSETRPRAAGLTDGQWETYPAWPPAEAGEARLYISRGGILSETPQPGDVMKYVSDPLNPVPFCKEGVGARDAHAADQSFLEGRSDILSFVSEPLETTLKAEGHLKACLNITSSASDADIVVKLIDLRPDGCQLLIRSGVMPLRYRKSLSVPEPMAPGKAVDIEFSLNDIAHHFLRGHRIMIQIQSSLFPLVAMNPQTSLPNQYEARPEDYKKAEIALNCGPRSYIALSVVD